MFHAVTPHSLWCYSCHEQHIHSPGSCGYTPHSLWFYSCHEQHIHSFIAWFMRLYTTFSVVLLTPWTAHPLFYCLVHAVIHHILCGFTHAMNSTSTLLLPGFYIPWPDCILNFRCLAHFLWVTLVPWVSLTRGKAMSVPAASYLATNVTGL